MNRWRGAAFLCALLLSAPPYVFAAETDDPNTPGETLDWDWFGSLRVRPEYNDNLSDLFTGRDDKISYIGYRANVGASVDLDQDITVLFDIQSLGAFGENQSPQRGFQGFDESDSRVDLFRAYIEARQIFDTPFSARIGRQPLVFGDEWLLGDSDFYGGTSWDGLRGDFDNRFGKVSAFWAKAAETDQPGSIPQFGDPGGDFDLYGLWSTWSTGEGQGLDAAVLYAFDHRDLAVVPFQDKRFTAHARYHFGGEQGIFFNGDAGYQWGDTLTRDQAATTDIDATAFELTAGWLWERSGNPYRVWARGAQYSGDEASTEDSETFVPLAQDVHARYGVLDLWTGAFGFTPFIGGPSGFQVFQLGVDATLPNTLRLRLMGQKLWRDEDFSPDDNGNLGEEYALSIFYDYGRNVSLELGIGQLYPGGSIAREAPFFGQSTARRVYLNTVARF